MSAPDLIQPVVGFRSWDVDEDVWLASTAVKGSIWRRGENVAQCRRKEVRGVGLLALASVYATDASTPHETPAENCGCGLYACHTVEQAVEHFRERALIGAVVASGRLCAHRTGFRAERATVVLLAYNGGTLPESRVSYIARAYGAEVVPFDVLEEAAARYGDPVPKGLLPEPGKDEWQVRKSARGGLIPAQSSSWHGHISAASPEWGGSQAQLTRGAPDSAWHHFWKGFGRGMQS